MAEAGHVQTGMVFADSIRTQGGGEDEALDRAINGREIYWVVIAELPGGKVCVAPADEEPELGFGDVWLSKLGDPWSDHVYALSVRLRWAMVLPEEWWSASARTRIGTLAPTATRALCDWYRLRLADGEDVPPVALKVDEASGRYGIVVVPGEESIALTNVEDLWVAWLEHPLSGLGGAEEPDATLGVRNAPLHWAAADDARSPLLHAEVQEAFDLDWSLLDFGEGAWAHRHLAPQLGALVIGFDLEESDWPSAVEICGQAGRRTEDGFLIPIPEGALSAELLGKLAAAPIRMTWEDGREQWLGP